MQVTGQRGQAAACPMPHPPCDPDQALPKGWRHEAGGDICEGLRAWHSVNSSRVSSSSRLGSQSGAQWMSAGGWFPGCCEELYWGWACPGVQLLGPPRSEKLKQDMGHKDLGRAHPGGRGRGTPQIDSVLLVHQSCSIKVSFIKNPSLNLRHSGLRPQGQDL